MRAATIAGLGLIATAIAVPSYAGGGHVRLVSRSYDERPVTTMVRGLGPGCPDFTGKLVERRHIRQSGYLRNGVAKVSTVATARVRLVPADGAAISYRGSYREVQSGVFLDRGHRTRSASTLTVGMIHGTDGSTYQTVEVAVTSRRHSSDRFNCSRIS